jgi:hypothetical protein
VVPWVPTSCKCCFSRQGNPWERFRQTLIKALRVSAKKANLMGEESVFIPFGFFQDDKLAAYPANIRWSIRHGYTVGAYAAAVHTGPLINTQHPFILVRHSHRG